MTITKTQIFHIHRSKDLGASISAIALKVGLSRPTVRKYLIDPEGEHAQTPPPASKSKLDSFKDAIHSMLDECDDLSAVVIRQHLQDKGYDGGLTIVRDYLRRKRGRRRKPRIFLHFESAPGQAMQVDWARCGSIDYGAWSRPLYCFAMVECFSRMLHLEFTHSMKQEVFINCHVGAFLFFGGSGREIVIDNLKSAVIDRDGKLIQFNETYLDFLRHVHATPWACNKAAGWEKGKVEKTIDYIKKNYLPLRTFIDLDDANRQARRWRDEVANVRIHATTGERPVDRFKRVQLQSIVALDGCDSREVLLTKGRQTLRVEFDCNYYSIPHWAAGKPLEVKASGSQVTIYHKGRKVARHERCWLKRQSIVNPAHREGLTSHRQRARISFLQQVLLDMGRTAEDYLRALQDASRPIKRSIEKLVDLKDAFGNEALLRAMQLSMQRRVIGVEYVEQLLHQLSHPQQRFEKVQLRGRPDLAQLRLSDIDLKFYDTLLMQKIKERNHDKEERHDPDQDQGETAQASAKKDGRGA